MYYLFVGLTCKMEYYIFTCVMKGDVSGSVAEFDKAIKLDPRQKACEFPYNFFQLDLLCATVYISS